MRANRNSRHRVVSGSPGSGGGLVLVAALLGVAALGCRADPEEEGDGSGTEGGDTDSFPCHLCHGDESSPAPPPDLHQSSSESERTVGAHRSHLGESTWHAEVTCDQCHVVPEDVWAPGHVDTPRPAEITWGDLAAAKDAAPEWDGATCSGTYCHGGTLTAGGSNTEPTWTVVDGTQVECGTCHGLPPNAPHPQSTDCSGCHPTVDSSRDFVHPEDHINGEVDLLGVPCDTCHGSNGEAAPPVDLDGGSDTSLTGVGAHREHLAQAQWHAQVTCDQCHKVPVNVDDEGHMDTPRPAELTWGDVATADQAVPEWDGANCSGAYCHGGTLIAGGSNTTPKWTVVDDSQDACGTCHGLPPDAPHPPSDACEQCHGDVVAAYDSANPADTEWNDPTRHINGVVDVATLACDSCHGSDGEAAPPVDLDGNSDTSLVGVGAHREHLADVSWHAQVTCDQCHKVPTNVGDEGHMDTPRPAELTWGDVATADQAAPDWDGGNCSGVYCHGSTLIAGGTNTTPEWTVVDDTQDACGTCHGLPPDSPHATATDCGRCHPTIDPNDPGVFIDGARHIDGSVDIDLTCTSCHGDAGTDDINPPVGTEGETQTTDPAVGAHVEHLQESTSWHADVLCTACHALPGSVTHSNGVTDFDWSDPATADSATPSYDFGATTCTGVYCHGSTLYTGGSNTTPNWTMVDGSQDACGTCHGLPPDPPHPANADCGNCHSTMDPGAPLVFVDPTRHINGSVDF